MAVDQDAVVREESEHLSWTLERFRDILRDERERYDALPSLYRDDVDLLGDLMLSAHNRIARLERGLGKPYFARIDFTERGGATQRCYIGKVGVSDGDNRIVTVDWRAPVSTLYYDSNVGPARYEAPGGVVHGSLDLKRQIEVEEGTLLSVRDVDTVSNDELLAPYLGVNADNRLKNIVASIQGEQNRIIRERIEQNLIVQGAAGSGKTTVALHRIAYLAYTYRDSVRPGQFLVLGPNPTFIQYIASVLPDLDVDNVPQHTFPQLAAEVVGEPFTLQSPEQALCEVMDGVRHGGAERFKTSMRMKEALDVFLARFEESVVPREDFALHGFVVLKASEVAGVYEKSRPSSAQGTVLGRVERCVMLLRKRLRERPIELESRLSAHFITRYKTAQGVQDLDRMHRERAFIERELEQGCARTLRKHLSRVDAKILTLYRQFWQEEAESLDLPGAAKAAKSALSLLRRRTLASEDLAAVMYLCERVRGAGAWRSFRHCIVDEAQDYGEFELFVLRRVLSGSTFTIVGDLAQSIFGYRSVESWETVRQCAFPDARVMEMHKSYRTTVEIMRAANCVSERLGLAGAEPVIRHGDPVCPRAVAAGEMERALSRTVRDDLARGFRSVAVIAKTPGEARRLAGTLCADGIAARLLDGEAEASEGGVLVMTAYQAKGLEFDGAVLPDVSRAVYDPSRRVDLHLLYVAMTRPLHRLDLLYTGELTEPLRGLSESSPSES